MKKSVFTVCLLLLGFLAGAQQKVFQQDGVAIRGYDPVAYFTEGKPVKGSENWVADWQGARWRFASQQHQELFVLNPEKYAPLYGGYCAYGASEDHLSPTDPQAWTIVGGKLYLNYNTKVRSLWVPDTVTRIPAADKYWNSLKQ
jgi:YHS domain-containing protein